MTGIENQLGRAITADEVFQIPGHHVFEENLIAEGFHAQVESAISRLHGATALTDFCTHLHGQPKRGGAIRDYQSPGWQDRSLTDFCLEHMKSARGGATIAEEITSAVAAGTQPDIPSAVAGLFLRADTIISWPCDRYRSNARTGGGRCASRR